MGVREKMRGVRRQKKRGGGGADMALSLQHPESLSHYREAPCPSCIVYVAEQLRMYPFVFNFWFTNSHVFNVEAREFCNYMFVYPILYTGMERL